MDSLGGNRPPDTVCCGRRHVLTRPDYSALEELYATYNRREFVHPDPLEFLYRYEDPADREIAGLVASSLAYGNVKQILGSVSCVLECMGPPRDFLESTSRPALREMFHGFKHRWTTDDELVDLLMGAGRAVARYGSLQQCFLRGLGADDESVLPALSHFVSELRKGMQNGRNSLLPAPWKGSACKRLNLFLRWMVRRDAVDPGGWPEVPAARLLVPLDVHMHGICRRMGLTGRRQANMRTVREVTDGFAAIVPEDPVRYDFALTRPGIRNEQAPADALPDVPAGVGA